MWYNVASLKSLCPTKTLLERKINNHLCDSRQTAGKSWTYPFQLDRYVRLQHEVLADLLISVNWSLQLFKNEEEIKMECSKGKFRTRDPPLAVRRIVVLQVHVDGLISPKTFGTNTCQDDTATPLLQYISGDWRRFVWTQGPTSLLQRHYQEHPD